MVKLVGVLTILLYRIWSHKVHSLIQSLIPVLQMEKWETILTFPKATVKKAIGL